MRFYPLSAVIAFFGWKYVFVTSGRNYVTPDTELPANLAMLL